MTPKETKEFKDKLVSQMVAKGWQSITNVELDLGYSLLTVEQKNTICASLINGDHSALEFIRSFMMAKITQSAELQADNFIANSPEAAAFIANIL
jgi:hypothetical protein